MCGFRATDARTWDAVPKPTTSEMLSLEPIDVEFGDIGTSRNQLEGKMNESVESTGTEQDSRATSTARLEGVIVDRSAVVPAPSVVVWQSVFSASKSETG